MVIVEVLVEFVVQVKEGVVFSMLVAVNSCVYKLVIWAFHLLLSPLPPPL